MGDYYFPALIHCLYWIRTNTFQPHARRASLTPKDILATYLHNDGVVNHRIVLSYQLMVPVKGFEPSD